MCIFERIEEAAAAFTRETGKRPKSVYIGRLEMAHIKLDDRAFYHEIISTGGADRMDICGLSVYVVNAENHLGIGL